MRKTTPAPASTAAVAAVKINPALKGKYDDQPFFQEKVRKANELLAKAGPPKFPEPKQ